MARHSAASLAIKVFATGCGFVFAVLVARLLGPGGFGIVAVALSIATLSATFSLLGTNALAVREIATLADRSNWDEVNRFVGWSASIVFYISASLAAIVALATLFLTDYHAVVLLAALSIPLLAALQLIRGIAQGAGQVSAAQVPIDVIRWIVVLWLTGLLILFPSAASPAAVMLILATSLGASLIVAITLLRRYSRNIGVARSPIGNQNAWLHQSLPFLGLALFSIIGTETNTLLLGWLAGPREAGLYQPIAKLSPILVLAKEAVEMPLAPRIAQLWERGERAELQRVLRHAAVASGIATTLIASAILVISPYVFATFGPEFVMYQPYLYWIAGAQIANAFFGASPILLMMSSDMKRRLTAQGITLIIQSGLGVILVPALGVAGAVFALFAAILTWSLVHWIVAWKATGIDASAFSILPTLMRQST